MTNTTIENPLAQEVAPKNTAMVEVASSRQAQEVQASMVIAKKFPRDQNVSFQRIIQACKRKSLAEQATYMYPKGGVQVSGPSIRLAEVLSQNWGNVDSGVIELEQRYGESTVMAYAWDLETNARDTKVFTVKHEIYTKAGTKKLTDPREIYEHCANQGARRKRACILAIIPGDIVDAAVEECDKTLASGNTEPLIDRVRKMVVAFGDHGVTIDMIEARLGHNLDSTTEKELVVLRKIYTSLKDGMASREQFFTFKPKAEETSQKETETKQPEEPGQTKSDQMANKLKKQKDSLV